MKLSAVSSIVKGKRVVMVDDSIVRGTTSRRIVQLLRDAGAAEVHVAIGSPELKYPCFYGIDIQNRRELISANHTVDEVCEIIGADNLTPVRRGTPRSPPSRRPRRAPGRRRARG